MIKFWIVLKKELVDCFRDKRSLVMMILPLLIFPLLLTFYNEQIESANESLAEQLVLATNDEAGIAEVTDFLIFNDVNVEVVKTDDATTDLKVGKISLILNKDENGYHIIYDQNSIKSTKAVNIVGSATAAIISMLSLSAKSVKEGSLRINLFTLIPTVIGGASMYMETGNISIATNFIPIINVINVLKAIFINAVNTTHLLITVLSTAVYGVVFLLVGYWLINSEKVLNK